MLNCSVLYRWIFLKAEKYYAYISKWRDSNSIFLSSRVSRFYMYFLYRPTLHICYITWLIRNKTYNKELLSHKNIVFWNHKPWVLILRFYSSKVYLTQVFISRFYFTKTRISNGTIRHSVLRIIFLFIYFVVSFREAVDVL